MKLSKGSVMTFGIGGFAVVAAILGMAYTRQTQNQDQIRQQLSQVDARIAKLPAASSNDSLLAQQRDLEAAISKAQSDSEAAKSALTKQMDSIEITDQVARIASDSGVSLVAIDSPGLSQQQISGFIFSTLSFTAKAEGDVPNLVKFASSVAAQFPTAVVQSSQLAVPPPDQTGKGTQYPSVTITITMNSYEGS